MEKYYSFAGVELLISAKEEWMYAEDRSLASFRVSSVKDPHRFTFSMVEKLQPPSGKLIAGIDNFEVYDLPDARVRYVGIQNGDMTNAHMRTEHRGKDHAVELKKSVYQNRLSAKAVMNALEAEHLVAEKGGFIFHASYVDVGGRAMLFTAPSGTGKSTQADLWHRLRGARILNGDRCVVRCTEDGIFACGVPFMGSSQYCENVTLPLAGIVYLAQAADTTISLLTGRAAFRRVWEGITVNTWDEKDVSRVMDTVSSVIGAVPVWFLSCRPDETAVAALEEQLRR